MYLPDVSGDRYRTDPERQKRYERRKLFRGSFWFYSRYVILVVWSGIKFLFTKNPQKSVTLQALRVMRFSERFGAVLDFTGMDRFPVDRGPYVFACNHMGTFEVNALPGLVASRIPMTFVVKRSLLKTPFFGKVLHRLGAIPVERRHPGEDLMQVLKEGTRLLSEGVSVILFPESTRQKVFSSKKFNSLAVKLALRAGVPVVPVALRTDFWGTGKLIRDFGPLNFDRTCRIEFGEPIMPSGRGKKEHLQVLNFIASRLREWKSPVQETDAESVEG